MSPEAAPGLLLKSLQRPGAATRDDGGGHAGTASPGAEARAAWSLAVINTLSQMGTLGTGGRVTCPRPRGSQPQVAGSGARAVPSPQPPHSHAYPAHTPFPMCPASAHAFPNPHLRAQQCPAQTVHGSFLSGCPVTVAEGSEPGAPGWHGRSPRAGGCVGPGVRLCPRSRVSRN